MNNPNKYRRPFNWRLSVTDSTDLRKATEAFTSLSRSDYVDILEDFLELTRRRRQNHTAIAKVQIYLLQELIEVEAVNKKYRCHIEELRAKKVDQEKDETLDQAIAEAEREQFTNQLYGNSIRTIADGVAWRSLGYDRAVLRALCEHPTQQQLMSDGLLGELYEWTLGHREDGLAIFNAIANWLAIGDVTIVRPDDSVEIVEVKSSNTSSNRVVRQKRRMRNLKPLLSNGQGIMQSQELEILTVQIEPQNGLDEVGRLLALAEVNGVAAKRISNCLYVECVDIRAVKDVEKAKLELVQKREHDTEDWIARNDFVLDMNSHQTIAFSPNRAPFSVFPFPSRTCVDLMVGSKWFTSYLNLDAVAREFEHRGWRVERPWIEEDGPSAQANDPTGLKFIASKDGCYSYISPGDCMRMHTEFLRPQVVIAGSEYVRALGPDYKHRFSFLVYEHEGDIWD
jgi:hypothetical protein